MPPVHICNRTFRRVEGHPEVSYEVLVDGEKYRCDEVQLDLLYDGISPVDLELVRLEDDA